MVHHDTVANLCCFSNDDAHAMVDKEAFPNLGSWMNFNSRQEASDLGKETWKEGKAKGIKKVRDTMRPHSPKTRVEKGFKKVDASFESWVFFVDGFECGEHKRKAQ